MTTSRNNSFFSEILKGERIPTAKLAYFRGRLSNRIHALVLEEFARLESEGKINRADLARRIARKPEQITRWLGSAGNWTFDTFSDLMLGMGLEPDLGVISLRHLAEPEIEEQMLGGQWLGNFRAANDSSVPQDGRRLGAPIQQPASTVQTRASQLPMMVRVA